MSNSYNTLDADTLLDMAMPNDSIINQGSAEDQMLEKAIQKAKIDSVDIYTGAPANVRMAVGAAQNDADRLATLKQFYPEAQPVELFDPKHGVARFGAGNFVYEDPETKKLTLFDEENRLFGMPIPFTLRDLADVGPEVAETAGAIGGAAIAGIPTAAATVPTMGPAAFAPISAAIMAGEGLGAATAREAYITALDFFGETEDNRSGMDRLLDFGFTGTINALMGPVVHKLFSGIKGYVGGKMRYDNGVNSPDAKQMLEMMEDVGVTNPTAGQVTGNPLIQLTESALSAMPMSTKIMQESARQTIKEMDEFAAGLTYRYGGARTYAGAADELVMGAKRADEAFKTKSNELYKEVARFLPEGATSNASGVSEFVAKYAAKADTSALQKTYAPAMEAAANLLKDVKGGKLTYEVLKDFRSSLGNDLSSAKFRGAMTASDNKLDELYGYISRDMDAMIEAAGPEAKAAYKAANDFTREKLGEGTGSVAFIKEVIRRGKKDATDALDFALRKTDKTGARLAKLKEELSPEEFEVISGFLMGRMGLPTAGRAGVSNVAEKGAIDAAEVLADKGFSPQRFLTNYNKLAPEAQQILFGNDAALKNSLDNFTVVLERVAKDAESMSNPSGTARVLGAMGMFGPAAGGAGIEALTGVGAFYDFGFSTLALPMGSAKLMTSARFVNWLAEGVETAVYNPQSMGQHVRRLYQIYEAEPAIRDEIQAIAAGHIGETVEPVENKQSTTKRQQAPEVKNELSFRGVSTSEVANKVLPQSTQLAQSIDSFQMPQVQGNVFNAPSPTLAPQQMVSPTLLPNEDDREIAMRQQAGIAGLV